MKPLAYCPSYFPTRLLPLTSPVPAPTSPPLTRTPTNPHTHTRAAQNGIFGGVVNVNYTSPELSVPVASMKPFPNEKIYIANEAFSPELVRFRVEWVWPPPPPRAGSGAPQQQGGLGGVGRLVTGGWRLPAPQACGAAAAAGSRVEKW